MDRSEAAYEAYGGVKLELLGGRVVQCPPLTVEEALRYLRLFERAVAQKPDALAELASFVVEFPARIGIVGERMADVGIEVEGLAGAPLDLGDLTVLDGLEFARLYELAVVAPELYDEAVDASVPNPEFDAELSAKAQIRILDEFPATFGLDPSTPVSQVFGVARRLQGAVYQTVYGLAQDFYRHLTASPPVMVMKLRAPAPGSSFGPTAATTT